jgi:Fur family zinc uptake transcriptional regulator
MDACSHTHALSQPVAADTLDAALSRAADRCAQSKERLTPARRRVLELLLRAGQPAKAYDLIAAFGENGAAAKPPTVYRALDFLSRQGFVHRIESLNAYMACHLGERDHAAAFLICTCCGATEEIEPFAPERVQAQAAASGYVLNAVIIEAQGLCLACAPTSDDDLA